MIWVRRTAAAALAVLLFGVLLSALVLQGVTATFLRAGFYTDQLTDAGAYRFVLDDVLPSAIDEVREEEPDEIGVDLRENPVAVSGLDTPRIAGAVQRALSPGELEDLVAPAVHESVSYATGESDVLTIDPQLGEVVRDIVAELLALMREADVYERLLERELEPRIREAAGEALSPDVGTPGWTQRLFGGDEEAGGRLSRVVLSVVTPGWFGDQVEQIVEALTSYLVGDSDGFEIHVRLGDEQVDAAVEELRSVLRGTDSADLVYADILDPRVDEEVEETVQLPYGVAVSRGEVKAVLREVAPRPWVQQQADAVLGDVSSYVAGRSDGFSTAIALAERKQEAAQRLTELAVARVAAEVEGLETCAGEAGRRAAAAAASDTLPECLPAGVASDDLLAAARAAIAAAIPPLVLEPVPDAVVYTDEDLRRELRANGGPGALEALDDTRELFAEGWRYSDADLRADLASDPELLDGLDRLREFLADGYVHRPGAASDSTLAGALETMRSGSDSVRRGGMIAWLAVALLVVAIGALGGTSWAGRGIWASASLLACAALLLLLSWPVYEVVSDAASSAIRAEIADQPDDELGPTARLLVNKLVDVGESVSDDFARSVRLPGFVVAAVALVGLLGAAYGERIGVAARSLRERV
ncbi:MAG: hypothetical protein OXC94_03800 [Chloroflexi bacterium]|nr:hypothetical protein [Chloroflexota bacterium]